MFFAIILGFYIINSVTPFSEAIEERVTERVESNEFQCPEQFGHFENPTDCTKYWVCNHGRGLSQSCDSGLLYNVFLKTCDWPRNVRCDRGGKRVNTKRNPDLNYKISHNKNKEFEETNNLNSEDNDYDNPSSDHNQDFREEYRPLAPREQPTPNRRMLETPHRSLDEVKKEFPKWNQDIRPNQRPQSRGPAPAIEIGGHNNINFRKPQSNPKPSPPTSARVKPEDDNRDEYEYDVPDYYEYEEPVHNVRKPVEEAEEKNEREESPQTNSANKKKEPSVKRIGWLPEDPDSNEMDRYHWSPDDAVGYSKYKPRIPSEAYVSMKDFRNTEKQLELDNEPNVGPPPEEDDDEYPDYYEDDEEPPHNEEDHHHHNEDDKEAPPPEEEEAAPLSGGPTKEVRYDDEEEVHHQPRVSPQSINRPPVRNQVQSPPSSDLSHKPAPQPNSNRRYVPKREPFTRIKASNPSDEELSGLRTNDKPYESVPKVVRPEDETTDQFAKPMPRTNIHYKNINSPYLRPVLDQERDRQEDRPVDNQSKGKLINSVPRSDVTSNPNRRVVIRKVIKKKRPLVEDRSESVTPSIYQLLDDYRKELPDAILTHKKTAQEFRDSIVDNYMNNDKPNYILNDKDFDSKSFDSPKVNGEGEDSEHVRDWDKDFDINHSKQNKSKDFSQNRSENRVKSDSDRSVVKVSHIHSPNNRSEGIGGTGLRGADKQSSGQILNTDAIVKQQRAHNSVSPAPVEKKVVTKKPVINSWPKPVLNGYEAPKRTPFGFKQSVVQTIVPRVTTTTTVRPKTTPKPSVKPKIRIKTPKPKPETRNLTPPPKQNPPSPPRKPSLDPQWYQNINYEPKPSNTDITYVKASKCDPKYCQTPDCRCGGTDIPGGLKVKQTPQIILLTFDDSVNDLNWDIYDELFNSGRNNPNGCPISSTFYVSHEWTDYAQVQTLYSKGHEMASHSITHSFGEKFSKELWLKEIAGQRELLRLYGGVKDRDVRGMRAPFLQTGGNTMFEMLYEANFTYDSSLPVYEINPPYYPYTLDYAVNHECMIAPCPTKSFPGLWEVGMVMWEDLRGGRCSMADACFNPKDEETVYEMVKKNFDRHYNGNRAPFGIYFHSRWFLTEHNRKGFIKFLDDMMANKDVYFVTNWQMIQWMRDPQPLSNILSFKPWMCDQSDRPSECLRPNQCKVKFRSETRVLKTCQPCPKTYPWRGNNGLRKL